jgi:hypothetical protein
VQPSAKVRSDIECAQAILDKSLYGALRPQRVPRTLVEKLTSLRDWCGIGVLGDIIPPELQSAWITVIKNVRNDIIHDGDYHNHAEMPALIALSVTLRWSLELALLTQVGIPEQDRKGATRRS